MRRARWFLRAVAISMVAGVLPNAARATAISASGYVLGNATAVDEIEAWRSTSIAKTLDPDGDHVYGTAGYIAYATDVIGNSNGGSVPTADPLTYSDGTRFTIRSIPAFLTVANDGQYQVATSYGYPAIDDPSLPVGGTVADREADFAIRGGVTLGVETGMVSLTVGAGFPAGGIRLGVMIGNTGDAPDKLRLVQTAGGTAAAEYTGIVRDLPFDLYFFDLTDLAEGDSFRLDMRKPAGGPGNPNLAYAGLTMDIIPEPGAAGLLVVGVAFLRLACRRRVG